jgi:hypothetical protein
VIPKLTRYGVLPPTRHPATFTEVEQQFVTNAHRRQQWDGLVAYVAWVRSIGLFKGLYLGGSFVTDEPTPEDIDVAVIARGKLPPTTPPNVLMVAQPAYTKQRFGVQAWPGPAFLLVFEQMRNEEATARGCPPGTPKGVLAIPL